MSSTPTVLVYDDALETSEVLAAVYRPRGFEVQRLRTRGESAGEPHPGGAVVMLSSHDGERSRPGESPLRVMIGRMPEGVSPSNGSRVAACRLSSLFDYGELVIAIDRLLCETG
jgi:hypothetical protein